MEQQFSVRMDEYRRAVEEYLQALFTQSRPYGKLYEAMRYSILAGGKRIRPVLTLEFCRLFGGDWKKALPFACALELVHTYSLIHDDLPCMDDDDLRRGKPTNHKVFGETMATLAGDALQPEAFRLLAEADGMSDSQKVQAVQILSRACGADGMVAGQVLDLSEDVRGLEQTLLLHRLKTGAMIAAAAELGCVAADAGDAAREIACCYGENLGLAFQICDDLLDVLGDEQVLGKPIGSDRVEGKTTFVDILGVDGAEREVARYTQIAKAAVEDLPDCAFLLWLAAVLAERRH